MRYGSDAIWQATLDDLHTEGRLGADAHVARLTILGAINDETSALFLREVSP